MDVIRRKVKLNQPYVGIFLKKNEEWVLFFISFLVVMVLTKNMNILKFIKEWVWSSWKVRRYISNRNLCSNSWSTRFRRSSKTGSDGSSEN